MYFSFSSPLSEYSSSSVVSCSCLLDAKADGTHNKDRTLEGSLSFCLRLRANAFGTPDYSRRLFVKIGAELIVVAEIYTQSLVTSKTFLWKKPLLSTTLKYFVKNILKVQYLLYFIHGSINARNAIKQPKISRKLDFWCSITNNWNNFNFNFNFTILFLLRCHWS